jgi:hypothetical protein
VLQDGQPSDVVTVHCRKGVHEPESGEDEAHVLVLRHVVFALSAVESARMGEAKASVEKGEVESFERRADTDD